MKQIKLAQTEGDLYLYVSKNGAETLVIALIVVYVDDILTAANTDEKVTELNAITNHFDVKDLELRFFLGVKVVQDQKSGTIWLEQTVYSGSSLISMQNAKTCKTPANPCKFETN